jgi:carboxypeptidase Q
MRLITTALAAALLSTSALAQTASTSSPVEVSPETHAAVTKLIGDIMVNGKAYDYDRQLSDTIGPRLTGSDNYVHAVSWAVEQFKALGLANVHTEPFTMPALWEPEVPASGRIIEPRIQNLHIYSLGWSPSTPEGGIKGQVVHLKQLTIAGVDAQKDQLKGKIVLVDNESIGDKPALGDLFKSFDHLAALNPAALLLVGGANGTENASALTFSGTLATYPQAQVGREDVLLIRRLLEKGPVTIEFSFKNRIRPATEVNNVIAEIPGSDLPNEIVIVGGHLDSWHPATGAQDNGTGASTVIEVARAIQSLNRPPRRTMRFILFGGEEQGLIGSNSYVKHHTADMAKIDTVLISDTGAQPAKGWYLMGRDDEKQALTNIEPLLAGLGGNQTTSDTEFIFETDHAGFDVLGVPTLVLWTGVDKYFKLHHQASDSFDSVVQADLNQGVAVTAVTAYAIADAAKPFAPHDTQAQVEDMLKKANQLDDYKYFKSVDILP